MSLSTGEKDLGSLNIEPAASGSRNDETDPTIKDDSKDGSLEPSEGRMENVDLSIASVRFDNTPVADDGISSSFCTLQALKSIQFFFFFFE